ncbi:MAG: hypothetical protein AAFU79_33810, partial [Myxococcota bacterium]
PLQGQGIKCSLMTNMSEADMTHQDQIFTASHVSRLTGVPSPTIQSFLSRDKLTNLDAQRDPGRGSVRKYSEADVYAIAAFAWLNNAGLAGENGFAGQILHMYICDVLEGADRRLVFVYAKRSEDSPTGIALGVVHRDKDIPAAAIVFAGIHVGRVIDQLRPDVERLRRLVGEPT